VLRIVSTLVGSLVIVIGAIALISGWIVPWLRGQTVRPRLWGVGVCLLGANCVAFGLWPVPAESQFLNYLRLGALVVGGVLIALGTRLS
jgi:hypothetical protein